MANGKEETQIMLELRHDNTLIFSFPEVHKDARFNLNFQRTLRIPDDGKDYPLPPGLGTFPVKHVDDHKDRAPAKWAERGGVMLPLFQSEALWIYFQPHRGTQRPSAYPMAIRVATGKVSAVTGEPWKVGFNEGDYLVAPPQPWLDGYVVEKGLIRQFVAAPLGWGFSAEEQLTGKAEHGGIQIEVIPMKAEVYERRFPKREARVNPDMHRYSLISDVSEGCVVMDFAPAAADMGLAPGGKMKQQVHEDPFDFNDWDVSNRQRTFVHLANSLVWKAITRQDPPHPPPTAADYTARGLPWFEYYKDDAKTLVGTGKLAGMKSVMAMGFQKGLGILPENETAEVKPEQTKQLADKPKNPDEVREGSW
jgi:hypothetical protein